MTTNGQRQSATIYDFAERSRAILAARGRHHPATTQAVPVLPATCFGSGGYHEAALREADPTRKG